MMDIREPAWFGGTDVTTYTDDYVKQAKKLLEPQDVWIRGEVREETLNEALAIVMHDRNSTHGDPEDNFRDIAELWTTYTGFKFEAHDVAAMMILVKISRIKTSPHRRDHWVDAAGYAGCGAETAESPDRPTHPIGSSDR